MNLFLKFKIVPQYGKPYFNSANSYCIPIENYAIKKQYLFFFYKYIRRPKSRNKYNCFLGYKFVTSLEGAQAYINNEMKKYESKTI